LVYYRRAAILALLLAASPVCAEPFLRIIQPYEGASLPPVKESFVFGSVLPATATLIINGTTVTPHTNGGFLTMIPFTEGKFTITAVASDGTSSTTVKRTLSVSSFPVPPTTEAGRIEPVSPQGRVVVRPGDVMSVSCQGAQGSKALFKFKKRDGEFPMNEVSPGLYKGVYKIQQADTFDDDDIIYILKRSDGKRITQKAGVEMTVQRRQLPRYIDLKEDSILLTGPGSNYGYYLFLLKGARMEVTGEWGDFVRVALDRNVQGWLKKSAIVELPAGTPPARSVARNIRVSTTLNSTIIELPLQFVHPHRIEQFLNPHRLRLTLYGVVADTDRIRYKSRDTVVNDISWSQPSPSTYVLDVQTNQKMAWGYDVRYEGTTLVLEIRNRPKWQAGLKGLKIAVDAGHSPSSFGTIGPWGNTEASVALLTAKAVKQYFEQRGAEVVMIQDGTREMSLQDRTAMAWASRADFYISIHCDACPEGQNPREVEGYSVHYYHPQSRLLAEEIHTIYGDRTKFRDQGLWRSNLAVCRTSAMPSILLETGFLMFPEYEELMLTPKHQENVAEILYNAIVSVMKKSE
jgi:N-acetylmuramoyl-L-alanine amidase